MKVVRQQARESEDWPSHRIDLGTFCRGNQLIWQDLRFNLVMGGWTGFLGKSGIGKTTLLRCLSGLEAGQPFFLKDLKVALLAQNDNLLPWATILENVTIGASFRGDTIDRNQAINLLQQVGLQGYADRYPMQLSMGMRQRVALARTLYEKADFILLDEPFSALDTKIKYELYALTQNLLAEKTVLIVTHDPLEALTLCQQIYLFQETPTTLVPFELTATTTPSTPAQIGNSPDLNRLMEAILCG
ncbi:ATP-binding cassette domain-containing protein [Candidatus Paracaedibacter symbiosus]|uniref:ATP-binding cassette domain-containing protein n=1 Tax=Candidatus Paracaedibacter symbiosus TaxID=244582 RepID=UPI00068CEFF6|nr:ATP-binding cassette domain-containing protein [Candidatus Paracaedibacter symbiosus]